MRLSGTEFVISLGVGYAKEHRQSFATSGNPTARWNSETTRNGIRFAATTMNNVPVRLFGNEEEL